MASKSSNKTKKPNGLGISRRGKTFTCSWKIADSDYGDGQDFEYRTSDMDKGKWKSDSVGTKTTQKNVKVSKKSYYPYKKNKNNKKVDKPKLTSVTFRVRGNQKKGNQKKNPSMSEWSSKSFEIEKPDKPSVGVSYDGDTHYEVCTFGWACDNDVSGHKIFSKVCYQSILLKNTSKNPSEIPDKTWESGGIVSSDKKYHTNKSASKSVTYTEETDLRDGSYTRYFRVKAMGPAGDSKWAYAKHVYATPKVPKIIEAKGKGTRAGGIICDVTWEVGTGEGHPIDVAVCEWTMAVPGPDKSCPSGVSWNVGKSYKDTAGKDFASFAIDDTLDYDTALFVRVRVVHGPDTNYSIPKMVTGLPLALSKPSGFNAQISQDPDDPYKVTVYAQNDSQVEDSKLAVICRKVQNEGEYVDEIIGLIPNNTGNTFRCPPWNSGNIPDFGIYAFVGDYTEELINSNYSPPTDFITAEQFLDDGIEYSIRNLPSTVDTFKVKIYMRFGSIGIKISNAVDFTYGTASRAQIELRPSGLYETMAYRLGAEPFIINVSYDGNSSFSADLDPTSGTASGYQFSMGCEYGFKDSYSKYSISNVYMESDKVWEGGKIPKAPKILSLAPTDSGAVNVKWSWDWKEADVAELSWSDHADAWESTDEPQMYRITNLHSASWNIYGLDSGVKWYIRVRLIKTSEDSEVLGPWSDLNVDAEIDLSAPPDAPTLVLEPNVLPLSGEIKASWDYISRDGTEQASAHLVLVTEENGELVYSSEPLAKETTAKQTTIKPSDPNINWATGQTYWLAVQVQSESGRLSEWSDITSVTIADPLTIELETPSLVSETISFDDEVDDVDPEEVPDGDELDPEATEPEDQTLAEETVYFLEEMPIELTVTGAGSEGETYISIIRKEPYQIDRPDESIFNGYKGEAVFVKSYVGENPITITLDDPGRIGSFDDTAEYTIRADIFDNLGQTASTTRDFTVRWDHQALMPSAEVEIDEDELITLIRPIAPSGTLSTDRCDIYRLSVDKPVLIFEDAEFYDENDPDNTTYVDPYPSFGSDGGHRVVFKTANGDFVTSPDDLDHPATAAWIDLDEEEGDIIETPYTVIDFGTGRLQLLYNIDLSNSWSKDFKETKYLGGHIQGDWNPAVSRTGSINTVNPLYVETADPKMMSIIRKLADYPGICHIRTRDGSSFAADVQVSETMSHDSFAIASYTFNFTRVDSESLDGMTLAKWNSMHIGGGE